jgi:hypothetical protein
LLPSKSTGPAGEQIYIVTRSITSNISANPD